MNMRLLTVPIYLALYAACYYAAYLLRFDFDVPELRTDQFLATLPYVLVLKILISLAIGDFRRTFRYVSFDEALWIVAGAIGAAVCLYGMNWAILADLPIPRSVLLIDAALTILAAGVLRGGYRVATESLLPLLSNMGEERVLIYGSSSTSVRILRALPTMDRRYRVVGFVDEHTGAGRRLVAGIPVVPAGRGWHRLSRRLRARRVLIPGSVPGRKVREILENCAEAGMKAHVIPEISEIVDGRYKLGIRDVTISDLLRREPAHLDMESIREHIGGRRVLVTGAAGSIGSELCRQILALGPSTLVMFDQSEFGIFSLQQELLKRPEAGTSRLQFTVGDVTDRVAVGRVMQQHAPQMVFHAAAYKHVPLMEEHPQEAIRNNVLGTKMVADLADEFGVERFVLISTDKVVKPSSVMGSTKLVAEKYVQAVASASQTWFITVRFGNVLNSAGSVVPIFRSQIEAGGPITVTHPEMVRFFMTIPEAVELVLQAGAVGGSGDVLILDMGEPVRIVDLARDMILLSGLRYPDDIDIVFSGVRPGEKLAEELFYDAEEHSGKLHEKIFRGSGQPPQLMDVKRDLKRLEAVIDASTDDALAVLRDVVAGYAAAGATSDDAARPDDPQRRIAA